MVVTFSPLPSASRSKCQQPVLGDVFPIFCKKSVMVSFPYFRVIQSPKVNFLKCSYSSSNIFLYVRVVMKCQCMAAFKSPYVCICFNQWKASPTCQMPIWSKLQWLVPHLLPIIFVFFSASFMSKELMSGKSSYIEISTVFMIIKLPQGQCELHRCWTSDLCLLGSPYQQRTLSLREK